MNSLNAAVKGPVSRRQILLAGVSGAATLALPRLANAAAAGAATTPTLFVETGGRQLAYRSVGQGKPIVLCHRFLGVMDWWDPGFIDALAAQGFRVIYFDYTGMGQSSGSPTYDVVSLARDAKDLVDGLGLKDTVIGGWSVGGMAAQIYLASHSAEVSHVLLIGTTPPGPLVKTTDPVFFSLAQRTEHDLDWFTRSFFEPNDAGSRAAAQASFARIAARRGDRSPEIPLNWALAQLSTLPSNPVFPADAVLAVLKTTAVPVLHLGADHDLGFPVENWYALNGQLPTVTQMTFPRSGHGPHQQYPTLAAEQIAAFINGQQ
ncbi:alpha/beta hydrolase [Duganella sp. LX20W]|uniref:Alpha/beta hydrolase n=1 Tax=Rugamonas brunnea TaxID=2758569 RepID=A0A7W2EWU0_9BURK|nr:alpha/beta hydrolase [Rugamonas brunnea]MBA5640057.1 alpha/beta hydrolase [Rugamonas brunnea]